MNMVGHASDTNCFASNGIYDLPDVAVYTFQMLFLYFGTGGLHMEDDVQIYFVV